MTLNLIEPNWPAPKHIKAYSTTRIGGFSQNCFAGLNLCDRVGDDLNHVLANRQHLSETLQLPSKLLFLQQVHGKGVVNANEIGTNTEADAVYSNEMNRICAVLTGDCLPILLCDRQGSVVAAIHGGWKSLAQQIITTTVN